MRGIPTMFRAVLVVGAVNTWTVATARADSLCNSVQGGAGTKPSATTHL